MKKILIIIFLFLSVVLNATTYYVSTTGGNAGHTGAVGDPWLTIAYACTHTTSGDIIHINAGTFNEGSCSLPVGVSIIGEGEISVITSTTLTAEWSPIIVLSSATVTNGNQSISYLKFDGGSLTAAQALWIEKRNNVIIHHCTFVDFNYIAIWWVGDGNWDGNPPANYTTGNLFQNNIITNCASYGSTSGRGALSIGGQEGMIISDNTIIQTGREAGTNGWPMVINAEGGWVKGMKIYNNVIFKDDITNWTFCIEGFHIYGLEMYGNTITGSVDLNSVLKGGYAYGAYFHDNIIGPETVQAGDYYGIDLEYSTDAIIIERNRFRNCNNGIIYAPREGSVISNTTVRYNIFENLIGVSATGVCFWPAGTAFTVNNYNIYNNTFYGNASNTTSYGFWFNSFAAATNVNVINNIFVNLKTSYFASDHADYITGLNVKNNSLYLNGNSNAVSFTGSPSGYVNSGNTIGDPLFISTSDFHLQSGSPAKDAGLNVELTTDFSGHSVPQGAGYDIGAYEYGTWIVRSGGKIVRSGGKIVKITQ